MPRGVPHSDETNVAVEAALLTGQGVSEVARAYNLPKSTVSRIKNELLPAQLEQVGTEKGKRIEALLFKYLKKGLKALGKQSELAADLSYLKQFPPQQLAVLHGVMADKMVRIIEASAIEPPVEPSAVAEDDDSEDEAEDEAED